MATAATRVPSSKDQHIIQTPEGHEIVSVEGGMSSSDTARTTDTPVLPVQHVDATGTVGGVTLNTALDKTFDSITAYPKSRNLSVISKTAAVTIGGGAASDTILFGIVITAALTGTCVITGFADSDGTAQSITLPAATTAGFKDLGGVLNTAGALTVTCSNASDDNLVSVIWMTA